MKRARQTYCVDKLIYKTDRTSIYTATKGGTRLTYILKQINIKKLTAQEIRELGNEYQKLALFNNKFILKVYEAFQQAKTYNAILENFSDSISLATYIADKRSEKCKFIKEETIWSIYLQLILAVQKIHSKNIILTGLNPDSILIKEKTNSSKIEIKIQNFRYSQSAKYSLNFHNNFAYSSPEMLDRKPYCYKHDIWSIGVIMTELCNIGQPFEGTDQIETKILQGNFNPVPSFYSKELKNMIAWLLVIDDFRRPSADEIMKSYVFNTKAKMCDLSDYINININLKNEQIGKRSEEAKTEKFAKPFWMGDKGTGVGSVSKRNRSNSGNKKKSFKEITIENVIKYREQLKDLLVNSKAKINAYIRDIRRSQGNEISDENKNKDLQDLKRKELIEEDNTKNNNNNNININDSNTPLNEEHKEEIKRSMINDNNKIIEENSSDYNSPYSNSVSDLKKPNPNKEEEHKELNKEEAKEDSNNVERNKAEGNDEEVKPENKEEKDKEENLENIRKDLEDIKDPSNFNENENHHLKNNSDLKENSVHSNPSSSNLESNFDNRNNVDITELFKRKRYLDKSINPSDINPSIKYSNDDLHGLYKGSSKLTISDRDHGHKDYADKNKERELADSVKFYTNWINDLNGKMMCIARYLVNDLGKEKFIQVYDSKMENIGLVFTDIKKLPNFAKIDFTNFFDYWFKIDEIAVEITKHLD